MKRGVYLDVGGVFMDDVMEPARRDASCARLSEKLGFSAEAVLAEFLEMHKSLDLGIAQMDDLAARLGVTGQSLTDEFAALHSFRKHALDLIREIRLAGHPVGLATNFADSVLKQTISTVDFPPLDALCCSSNIGTIKPSERFYIVAEEMLGTTYIIFVDDREPNLVGARRRGWSTIHAAPGWEQTLRAELGMPTLSHDIARPK